MDLRLSLITEQLTTIGLLIHHEKTPAFLYLGLFLGYVVACLLRQGHSKRAQKTVSSHDGVTPCNITPLKSMEKEPQLHKPHSSSRKPEDSLFEGVSIQGDTWWIGGYGFEPRCDDEQYILYAEAKNDASNLYCTDDANKKGT